MNYRRWTLRKVAGVAMLVTAAAVILGGTATIGGWQTAAFILVVALSLTLLIVGGIYLVTG